MWVKLLYIAVGGALGALARYGLSGVVQRIGGTGFPWGTAVVNVLGCFIFGVIWSVAANRWTVGGDTRAILFVGFLGAFTTFSTFVSESGQLMADGEWLYGMGNILLQVVAGLGVFFLGMIAGRTI